MIIPTETMDMVVSESEARLNSLRSHIETLEKENKRLSDELLFAKESAQAWENNCKDGWAAQEACSKREDVATAKLKELQTLIAKAMETIDEGSINIK